MTQDFNSEFLKNSQVTIYFRKNNICEMQNKVNIVKMYLFHKCAYQLKENAQT